MVPQRLLLLLEVCLMLQQDCLRKVLCEHVVALCIVIEIKQQTIK